MTGRDILVVDDDPDINEVVRAILVRQGHRVRTAENGCEALAALKQRRPAVVLLDLMMPAMTGLELLEAIARDESLAAVRVVVMSAWARDAEAHPRVLGVIVKPFDLKELLVRVETVLAAV